MTEDKKDNVVALNGEKVPAASPDASYVYYWYHDVLHRGVLKSLPNKEGYCEIEFRGDESGPVIHKVHNLDIEPEQDWYY